MSEESTTPDLIELTRRTFEAVNRRDLDAVMSRFPADGVYDTLPAGLMVYEGPAAIRAFVDEWWDAFEELALEPEEVLDLGHGIVLVVVCQSARPANSASPVQRRERESCSTTRGVRPGMGRVMIRRTTVYKDIDAARAAAAHLAKERG